jgi:hypothetical protein
MCGDRDSGSGTAPYVNKKCAVSSHNWLPPDDAPVLDNTGNMSRSSITENQYPTPAIGTLVSDIIASAGGERITE